MVLRAQEGEVLATLMQPVTFCLQPDIAEAQGWVTAAGWCKAMGLQHVVFEGDSRQVVNAVKNDKDQHGILSCLVRDAKSILADMTSNKPRGKEIRWHINWLNKQLHYLLEL